MTFRFLDARIGIVLSLGESVIFQMSIIHSVRSVGVSVLDYGQFKIIIPVCRA